MRPPTFVESMGISTGFLVPAILNTFRRRPPFSGVQLHFASAAASWLLVNRLEHHAEKRRNRRILLLEDYIAQHPEDFEEPPPKKWKDVMQPWYPNRA